MLSFRDYFQRVERAGLSGRCFRGTASHAARCAARLALVCVALVIVAGCASFERADAHVKEAEAGRAGVAPERAVVSRDMVVAPMAVTASAPKTAAAVVEPAVESDARQERLRVYSANLALSVPRVDRARSEAISLVEDSGGYVESSTDRRLVLRVPAERFFDALERIERLGETRRRSVETADVTDQFADLERRILIAERSRARLRELLEEVEDSDERVAVLRDIRRLTEEIERLRSALSMLSELISFSRIDLELIERVTEIPSIRREIPFGWISALDPLVQSAGALARPIRIEIPADYAVFSQEKAVRAEAADGTRIRLGGIPNEPYGDIEFWAKALHFHLGPLYAKAEIISAGGYRGVMLESGDAVPFIYLVLVRTVRTGELAVAELFFPNPQAKEERLAPILKSIEEADL